MFIGVEFPTNEKVLASSITCVSIGQHTARKSPADSGAAGDPLNTCHRAMRSVRQVLSPALRPDEVAPEGLPALAGALSLARSFLLSVYIFPSFRVSLSSSLSLSLFVFVSIPFFLCICFSLSLCVYPPFSH